ncbi:hypothetical protein OROHE_001499 [Orobanche hederae]
MLTREREDDELLVVLLEECPRLIGSPWESRLGWVPRRQNRAADFPSRAFEILGENGISVVPPSQMRNVLLLDSG